MEKKEREELRRRIKKGNYSAEMECDQKRRGEEERKKKKMNTTSPLTALTVLCVAVVLSVSLSLCQFHIRIVPRAFPLLRTIVPLQNISTSTRTNQLFSS